LEALLERLESDPEVISKQVLIVAGDDDEPFSSIATEIQSKLGSNTRCLLSPGGTHLNWCVEPDGAPASFLRNKVRDFLETKIPQASRPGEAKGEDGTTFIGNFINSITKPCGARGRSC